MLMCSAMYQYMGDHYCKSMFFNRCRSSLSNGDHESGDQPGEPSVTSETLQTHCSIEPLHGKDLTNRSQTSNAYVNYSKCSIQILLISVTYSDIPAKCRAGAPWPTGPLKRITKESVNELIEFLSDFA